MWRPGAGMCDRSGILPAGSALSQRTVFYFVRIRVFSGTDFVHFGQEERAGKFSGRVEKFGIFGKSAYLVHVKPPETPMFDEARTQQ